MKDVDLYHDDCEFVLIDKYNKLKAQLKEAEKVIDLLYTREESTTLKSMCWIKAMEYKTKYTNE